MQPADLGPGEIDARLGAPWIPAGDVADFARDVLDCPGALVDYEALLGWTATAPTWQRHSVAATSEWGTRRADSITLLQAACNQQAPTVYDYHDDGTRTVNTAETLAAREKAEAITARFAAWVWEDPQRAQRLGREVQHHVQRHRPARLRRLPFERPGNVQGVHPPPAPAERGVADDVGADGAARPISSGPARRQP